MEPTSDDKRRLEIVARLALTAVVLSELACLAVIAAVVLQM
jgi:hypothetical protein